MAFGLNIQGVRFVNQSRRAFLSYARGKYNPIAFVDAAHIDFATMTDAGRDWTGATQDITVYFSGAMTDAALSVAGAATGFTVYINGAPTTPTYRSGSGTATWVLRIASVVRAQDVIGLSYNQSTGNTTAADTSELRGADQAPVTNSLSKRVRFFLKNKNNALVVSETVKAGIFEYGAGLTTNPAWMVAANYANVAIGSDSLFDMAYTGPTLPGGTVYVAVIRTTPVESFIWNVNLT